MSKVEDRRLSEPEAAAYLGGLSIHTLREWRSTRGKLGKPGPRYLKLGHRVFYRTSDLDAYMKRNEVAA